MRTRRWRDALGEAWEVELLLEGSEHPDTREPVAFDRLRFADGERTFEVDVRGETPEEVSEFESAALELALEAGKDGRGFLLGDLEGHLWWVKRGSEDDLGHQGAAVVFDDGVDERRHPGPLPADAEDLSDDELEELLTEAREVNV